MDKQVQELIDIARPLLGKIVLRCEDFTAATVAAAIRTRTGRIYTGVCLDLSCGIGFCAEHAAVAEMIKGHETEIEMIVAVGDDCVLSPCGRCRELLVQVNRSNVDAYVVLAENRIVRLGELLPEHWLTD
jgi:cytidine deaminase